MPTTAAEMRIDPSLLWEKLEAINKGVGELKITVKGLQDAVMGNGKDPLQRQIDAVDDKITELEKWQAQQTATHDGSSRMARALREWLIPIAAICSFILSALALAKGAH